MAKKNTQMRECILRFIEAYINKNGKSPSFREIAKETKLASSTVSEYVKRMASEGLIVKTKGKRSIRLK